MSWEKIGCADSEQMKSARGLVAARPSIAHGKHGVAEVFTEWHDPQTGRPVLRDYLSRPDTPCEHHRWTP